MKNTFTGFVSRMVCVIAGASALAAVAGETPALRQGQAVLHVSVPHTIGYLESLPADYASDPDKRWPLVIFLHGSGERGSDLKKVTKHGPTKMVEAGREFPFVLLSPQCPEGYWWDPAPLNLWLDQVVEKYRVDPERIYLTGLSMGGGGTWRWAQRAPERFAAIVPVCGGGDPGQAAVLKDLPIWAFHGALDTAVPPAKSEEMIAAIKAAGGQPRFTLYPDVAHDSWVGAYADEEMWTWLLAQRRAK